MQRTVGLIDLDPRLHEAMAALQARVQQEFGVEQRARVVPPRASSPDRGKSGAPNGRSPSPVSPGAPPRSVRRTWAGAPHGVERKRGRGICGSHLLLLLK